MGYLSDRDEGMTPAKAPVYVPRMTTTEPEEDTWEPTCVTKGCGRPLGYRVKVGSYGPTECPQCRSGSIQARLAASGISFREIAEPLDGLRDCDPMGNPYGPEFERWMAFLRRFASLTPGARMRPPFGFVCGSNGVGKSAGAQRALRDAIRNGCQGRFVTCSELVREIMATYGDKVDESASDRMRFYSSVHLLVLDEIGGETSDHGQALLFDVINARWSNELPTILTSNYLPDAESLGVKIGERSADPTRMAGILDRIHGGFGDQKFVITGESWRRGAA